MAILATQRVLTHDYWKFAHDLAPGDVVFDHNGKPTRITLAQTYRSSDCYEVTLNDHLTICGDSRLMLPVEDKKYRKRLWTYKGKWKFRRPLRTKTVQDLLETDLRDESNRLKFSIPTAHPIELPYQDLPVPPFVFGYWFFNRTSTKKLTTWHDYQDFVYEKFRDSGYKIEELRGGFITSPTVASHLAANLPTKIPNNYLLASVEQRIELLQGILMAKPNQYNQKRKQFRCSSQNQTIISQIQYLAESLGCRTTMQYDPARKTHTVFMRTKMKLLPQQEQKPNVVHFQRRYINKLTKLPDQLCVHIETDGPDQTILVGEGFIACL